MTARSIWSDPAVRAAVREVTGGRAPEPDVDDRPALRRLQEQDRSTYGQREVLVAAAALAIVEAIDVLAVTVRQMAAVLDRSGADR